MHLAVAGEALSLAETLGLDMNAMLDIVSGSAASSWMLRDRGPRMLESEPRVTSAVDIFVKDLGIVLEAGAGAKTALPLAATAHQMFLAVSGQGKGTKDDSKVIDAYRALQGRWPYLKDAEFRFYFGYWLVTCLLLTLIVWRSVSPGHLGQAARAAFFAGTSMLSTTGFCTADFDLWPASAKIILVLAMLVGGCAGSTAGAIKQGRVLVVLKRILRGIWQFMLPQAVLPLKLGRQHVEPTVADHISTYFGLYLLVFALATLGVSCFTDGETALSAVAATLGGVGPGFSMAGASETYAPFAAPAKAIFILCMLLGRLEFYALFAILFPRFWRR